MAEYTSEQLTDDEIKELKEVFLIFDKDRKGYITTNDLERVMNSLGEKPSKIDLQDMINEIDATGSGTIDFPEFLVTMKREMFDRKDEMDLLEAFRLFDKDGNGHINSIEFKYVMKNLNDNLSDEELDEMIKKADLFDDGQIYYEELVEMILSNNHQ